MARRSFGNGALFAHVAQRRASRDEAGKIYGVVGLIFVLALAAIPAIMYFSQMQ